ncbi:response regulator [Paenibacillus sp. HJL G12]|uniref:Response regulator n=1 Tax=Paenibacillus dendrobii TaxID=2691084 RepID=A0A7X3IGV2_9BACL|nr:response regulator [Paenibacillus dendrobii]MWV43713.1 response regulator [Paenibacillus dendrobii]
MYKVLIVDDEMIVRHAVKTLIHWEGSQFVYAGSAASGKSALRIMQEQPADIVITDIKMPEMDGIELIKQLLDSGFDGEILVLSNFNDFELVREALKCGAHDYMLKLTLKSDNFMQTLGEIATKLDAKKRSPGVPVSAEQPGTTNRLHDVLSSIYLPAGGADAFSIEAAEELWPKDHFVYTFVIQAETVGAKREAGSLEHSLSQLWSDVYPGSTWQCTVADEDQRFLFAAAYPAAAEAAEPAEMAERIISLASMYYSMKVNIIYGNAASQAEELLTEIRLCREAQPLLFYKAAGSICESCRSASDEDPGYQRLETEWLEGITKGQSEFIANWENRAQQMILEGAKRRIYPRIVKRVICEGMWTLSRKLGLEQQRGFDPSLWLERITGAGTDTEMMIIVEELAHDVLELAGSGAGVRANRPEVRKALVYLEENYPRAVTIHDVAVHVSLSETYLCQIFKTDTGKSMMTFLNELRMVKAYEMLSSGQMLVKEVAAEVGIHDPFYFNRLFKKHYGIPPKQVKSKEITGSKEE